MQVAWPSGSRQSPRPLVASLTGCRWRPLHAPHPTVPTHRRHRHRHPHCQPPSLPTNNHHHIAPHTTRSQHCGALALRPPTVCKPNAARRAAPPLPLPPCPPHMPRQRDAARCTHAAAAARRGSRTRAPQLRCRSAVWLWHDAGLDVPDLLPGEGRHRHEPRPRMQACHSLQLLARTLQCRLAP